MFDGIKGIFSQLMNYKTFFSQSDQENLKSNQPEDQHLLSIGA